MHDFRSVGMVDVRGQSAYQCVAAGDFGQDEDTTVDLGVCHSGVKCDLRDSECLYYAAVRRAAAAKLVVTNYQFFMSSYEWGDGIGTFDLLILDEIHSADGELSNFLTAEIDEWLLELLLGLRLPKCELISEWRDWGSEVREHAKFRLDTLTRRMKEARGDGQRIDRKVAKDVKGLRGLVKGLSTLADSQGEWIAEVREKKLIFAPVWPANYAEKVLFRKTPKVLLMSATLRPKTMRLLGIKEGLYDFLELDSTFPVENRPVIHVWTTRLNAQSSEADKLKWIARIDEIIAGRLDRKGIIHCTAYRHRDFIVKHSRFKNLMLVHDRKNVRSVVEKFKQSAAPKIIVSPSLTTGLDFPGTDAEWCCIAKMPFPDISSLITQAKGDADPQYIDYQVAQLIVQMAGRGSRSESDRFETLVLDDNWDWFKKRNYKMFPKWFLAACRSTTEVPRPLPKL